MLIEKINGGFCITEIVDGFIIRRRYFGYTKKDAIKLFKNEVNK